MAINLSKLSRKQLADLMNKARAREASLQKEDIAKVRAKVDKLLKAEGYTFAEVYGARGGRRGKRGKVAPKYRNPNGTETWSGRGKRPRWFNAALRAGKSEKSMLIK